MMALDYSFEPNQKKHKTPKFSKFGKFWACIDMFGIKEPVLKLQNSHTASDESFEPN